MRTRLAELKDLSLLLAHERHITSENLLEAINGKRVLLAEDNDVLTGWLRWNFFWDAIPFMNMLHVLESHRGKGVGTRLVASWEDLMRTQKASQVLTSTQSDETAQHFYRKKGYIDCGCLLLPETPLEIILRKTL